MLPPMSQLMPPLFLNHFTLINLINCPQMPVALVQENALENMILVRYGRFVRIMIQSELMLVVGAIERHLNLVRVLGVGVRVVHRPVPGGLVIRSRPLVLGERDLLFLLLGLRFRAQFRVEARLEILLEVVAVRVGNGDIVEEACAAEDEFLFPGGRFAEELLGIVGQDAEDHIVEGFGGGRGAGMFTAAELVNTLFALGVEGAGLEDHAIRRAGEDGGDVRVGADVDAFGAEVGGPVTVEFFEVWESNHEGEVR